MNENKIIFLGFANNIEEFYSIFGKGKENQNLLMIYEDVQLYKNIITITEEDINQYFGNYKNIEELRKASIEYFEKFLQDKIFDIGSFKKIRITKNSRKKYKTFSADKRKLLIVPKLLEILKTSNYKNSSVSYKERRDNIFKFHYFTNEVILKNEKYYVYITIGEDNRGNLFYDLNKNKKP